MHKFNQLKKVIDSNGVDPVVIVEVGSHWGQDTVRFMQAFKNVDIYSFEPNPISAQINEMLVKSALNGDRMKILDEELTFGKVNFELYQAAVSNQSGLVDFFCTYRDVEERDKLDSNRVLVGNVVLDYDVFSSPHVIAADGSSLNRLLKDEDLFKTIKVSTITLDEWNSKTQVDKIDLLWVDVQGHERSVIEGAKETLKNVEFVILETDEQDSYDGAMSKQETVELMKGLSFFPIMNFGSDVLFRRVK